MRATTPRSSPPHRGSSAACCAATGSSPAPPAPRAFGGGEAARTARAQWTGVTGTALHEALGMSECSTFLSGAPARPAPEGTLGFARRRPAARRSGRGRRRAARRRHRHARRPSQRSGPDAGLLDRRRHPELPLTGDWFETGDRVSRRPDGAFVYHGRRDDLITAGGFRVAPQEIEAVFHGAPGVEDCAALAISPKPDTTIIALAYAGAPPTPASPHWRRRSWRATSNRGPSSISTPCPDPRTESSTGARSRVSCERPWHDPARHHLRPDLPVVLYRLDQPRPRDGGAARPSLRDRVAPVPAEPRDARGRHGPPRIPGAQVRRQGGRGHGLRAGGGTCRTRGPDAEPRPDRTHAQHDRRPPPDPLGGGGGAADPGRAWRCSGPISSTGAISATRPPCARSPKARASTGR
jgi:hypothetical protein